ncbi:MAG: IS110 family transposase [Eubacteriaceae bacterium]|nr:IS110 family transposase [Eubacteriaceae bacterium]
MFGLVLKSLVAAREFRELREIARCHKKLVADRARHINRIEKLLQMNGFKLSSAISSISGIIGLKLLEKLAKKAAFRPKKCVSAWTGALSAPQKKLSAR